MTETTALLANTLGRVGYPLRNLVRATRDVQTMGFRTAGTAPSGARMFLPRATEVELPPHVPYMAGICAEGRLIPTAIVLDERLRWYQDTMQRGQIVVRRLGGAYPRTVLDGLTGRDASEVVDHPDLVGAGCEIIRAYGNAASLHLVVTTVWVDVDGRSRRRAA